MIKSAGFIAGPTGILSALMFSVAIAFGGAGGSAQQALQMIPVRTDGPQPVLVEMKGLNGDPMPDSWNMLLVDPMARGGVRLMTVINGVIDSERTPLQGFEGASAMTPVDVSKITIDTANLFSLVENEASRAKIGFDRVDYSLSQDPSGGEPVWTIRLYDGSGEPVGTMEIAAQGGTILTPLEYTGKKKIGGLIGRVSDLTTETSRKIGNGFLRGVGSVQEFLIGERTIGPREEN